MPPNDYDDEFNVAGCHGTVAEQKDEAYYDDRSDASDDMEKGRIKFNNNKLYGREAELETLCNIYEGGPSSDITSDTVDETEQAARVVFLSGYSGVGKSALVKEFVKQLQMKNTSSSSILHFSGKYAEQSSAAAPFSAISDLFAQMTHELSRMKDDELKSKILDEIGNYLASNTESDRVLRGTFPVLAALFDSSCLKDTKNKEEGGSEGGAPSMNSIRESVQGLISIISGSLKRPLILFLDDLQWADAPSLDLLSFLLSSDAQMKNVMFICAYRSNEVPSTHPFAKLMESMKAKHDELQVVETMDLFSLSQEVITQFIADSISKEEEVEQVAELADVVYQKTMGNIFCVMQAMEELVRKNALYYDMMSFEWRWSLSKIELSTTISDDVVETIKGKIKELPIQIQNLLILMSYIPNTLEVPVLTALMSRDDEVSWDEGRIADLLKEASDEAMLMYSVESETYLFAHDRIREASRESIADEDKDNLLLHLSQVLQQLATGPEMDWCLFVAVDLLNSLPSKKTNANKLARLNMRVASLAMNRGTVEKQSELLHEGLECLKATGEMWQDYNLTLSLLNAVITCDRNLGHFDKASAAIDDVLANAATLDDKFVANVNQFLVKCDSSRDYGTALEDGVGLMNLYGYNVPLKPTKADELKQDMKMKMALKNRPYSSLDERPVKEDPIFTLFGRVCEFALFQSHDRLLTILVKRLIRHVMEHGMGKEFPRCLSTLGALAQKKGKAQAATEIGNVTLMLLEKFKNDKIMYSRTKMIVICGLMFQMMSFRSQAESLLQCHKDLKFMGSIENALGSALVYFGAYLAAGFPLGPLLESKLYIVEEYGNRYDKGSFAVLFQVMRQFAINLRQRSENPTEFIGDAYKEEEVLGGMNDALRGMTLRDSSAYRIQLAFIFDDIECMTNLLDVLATYPYTFHDVLRLHVRLCFMGLAAFAVKYKNKEVGEKCLDYFQKMTKAGSLNAKPVFLLMVAMKKPSESAFEAAIDAAAEASTIHLEAMAKERYAFFLQQQNEESRANDCIASSYFSYYDWGAHFKALKMTQDYPFLKKASRIKAKSLFSTNNTETSSQSTSQSMAPMKRVSYVYNSTFRSKKEIKEET